MKKTISAILAAVLLTAAIAVPAHAAEDNPFTDVIEGKWYYKPVLWCVEHGYMTGTSDTTFEPNAVISRAMVVQVLWAIRGKPAPTGEVLFSDVVPTKWYADAVTWAAAEGIVAGTGADTFSPSSPVTREQFALILYNYVKKFMPPKFDDEYLPYAFNDFCDTADAAVWARNALAWATYEGLLSGTGTLYGEPLLSPKSTATRAQIATILKALFELHEPDIVDPAEPTEPTEPAEPTEPTDPVEPADPADPAPADPQPSDSDLI